MFTMQTTAQVKKKLLYQCSPDAHLVAHDKWKEDFLKFIQEEERTIKINTDSYLITAILFYNITNENEFKNTLEETLKINNTI